ncbi:propionyl-CoA--succinate CoA transferase [Mycolicibacterium sp. S2-37]|nr:propionyl-CoA--succinate CoA transferase [Mycolicibacterium sp. S2-37]
MDAGAALRYIEPGAELIVGVANGEPKTVIDAIETQSSELDGVRIHQMLPVRDRPYFHGERPGLRHVSWFLSPFLRQPFHDGQCDLVPNSFSEVPHLLRSATKCSMLLVAAAPPDEYGFFSLGANAEYAAALAGEMPVFIEANAQVPRTRGENHIHVRDIVGWCQADYPLIELPGAAPSAADTTIAGLVADRIPDGATLQIGIGSVPEQVIRALSGHRRLGIHTELFPEGFVDLIEGGAVTGECKSTHRYKALTTSAIGTRRLYDFIADNPGVEFWPVDYTNDPRVIGQQYRMNVVNATLEVDFLGQCASESLGSDYWSSSGGQPDFARGALFAEDGQSFIVLHSSNHDESVSRIVCRLHPGGAVTTFKNVVDKVVTEYGIAELRGQPIRERARRLIAIAHPKFRDQLEKDARDIGYL